MPTAQSVTPAASQVEARVGRLGQDSQAVGHEPNDQFSDCQHGRRQKRRHGHAKLFAGRFFARSRTLQRWPWFDRTAYFSSFSRMFRTAPTVS